MGAAAARGDRGPSCFLPAPRKGHAHEHFDHQRRRLMIFTKGQKVRELPIPHAPFWLDLERHILEVEAKPDHYLMPRMKGKGRR
jgi:hypothetical protein